MCRAPELVHNAKRISNSSRGCWRSQSCNSSQPRCGLTTTVITPFSRIMISSGWRVFWKARRWHVSCRCESRLLNASHTATMLRNEVRSTAAHLYQLRSMALRPCIGSLPTSRGLEVIPVAETEALGLHRVYGMSNTSATTRVTRSWGQVHPVKLVMPIMFASSDLPAGRTSQGNLKP